MSGMIGGEFGLEKRGVEMIPPFDSKLFLWVERPPLSPPVDDGL